MDADELNHLTELRKIHQKHLWALERQAAQHGLSVPPAIEIQIGELRQQLAQLDRQISAGQQYQVAAGAHDLMPHYAYGSPYEVEAGELLYGKSAVLWTQITTLDFAASATFINPSVDPAINWTYGFTFRRRGKNRNTDPDYGEICLFLRSSDSNWILRYTEHNKDGAEGRLYTNHTLAQSKSPYYSNVPGAANTLTLVTLGDNGWFAINGHFVDNLNLKRRRVEGTINLGVGYEYATHNPDEFYTVPFRDVLIQRRQG